ncbi:MAG: tyrosine-type recombinase/integrase [Thermincola sp.]|nr:tyrosine-type recombinase/integrase [Thermincola sp.]MDT3701601.1 tyrosine-type recombinase/integrase [Thermincola sp.]
MDFFRHTFGTMLAQAGENPKNLQMLLGHADIRTTMGTYCHTNIEDKKRAVEKLASIISL